MLTGLTKLILALFVLIILFQSFPVYIANAAICNSQSQCSQMLQDNQKAISSQKIRANNVQNAVSSLNARINTIQKGIRIRTQQINLAVQQINQTKMQINQKTKELAIEKANLNETIIDFYENGNQSTFEMIISSNNLSEVINNAQYSASVGDSINNAMIRISKIMADLKVQKKNLIKAKGDLEDQKNALAGQEANLQGQRQTQRRLLNNAQGTLANLRTQQASIQATIQAQLDIRKRSSWGTDLVQGPLTWWHKTQVGDYTPLGSSPYYKVNDSGCYITSLAMAATYYGHPIAVDTIANNPNNFYGDTGNFIGSVPGISISSIGLDFVYAKRYVNNGGLVIAKLVWPGAGYHFVVINGTSGGKYLIQDPLAPAYYESYSVSQVVDLRKISS